MTEKADDELRDLWQRWCEQVAAAKDMTYEQVVAELVCAKCRVRPPSHTIWQRGEKRTLCCECYVGEGNPPADWHDGCMRAAKRA